MDAHATASTSTTGDQQRRAAQHTYPPSQQPPSRRSSSPSSTTVLSIGFQLARLIQMVVTRFLSLLGNTLPLSVLLPSITLQPGSLVGVAPPDEAAEGYRRRLEVFCQSYNPPDTDSHADLASSSSTLPNDDAVLRVPRSLLPGSYDDAIARSKSENQVLMVVLESGPHQSTTRFRTETLLNPYLDTLLSQEGILLWSADVCDRDGTQVAQLLQATRFPFVAFISAQPKPSPTSSARTRMAVLSRHEGLSAVGLATISEHIRTVLVPRVSGYLSRLRREQSARTAQYQALEMHRQQQERYDQALRQDQNQFQDHSPLLPMTHDAEPVADPIDEHRARYLAWRQWATSPDRKPDARLPTHVDAEDPDTLSFVIRSASGSESTIHLPRSAPIEALFAAIELESPVPDAPIPPACSSTTAQWPKYNFSFVVTSSYPRRTYVPSTERLAQPLQTIVTDDEPEATSQSGPVRATLLIEGTPGFHPGSYRT